MQQEQGSTSKASTIINHLSASEPQSQSVPRYAIGGKKKINKFALAPFKFLLSSFSVTFWEGRKEGRKKTSLPLRTEAVLAYTGDSCISKSLVSFLKTRIFNAWANPGGGSFL